MPELKDAPPTTVRRMNEGRFNLSAVFETKDGFDVEQSVDLSFLDPPTGKDELGFINHYRVLRVLGTGGMGIVLEAEDTHLKTLLSG